MTTLSTGPIENNPVLGVRPAQLVTVKIVNRGAAGVLVINILGYFLNTTRTLYVSEAVEIAPGGVVTRDYFADLDAFEFLFTGDDLGEKAGISVWGKQADGQLVDAHRVVTHEKWSDEL